MKADREYRDSNIKTEHCRLNWESAMFQCCKVGVMWVWLRAWQVWEFNVVGVSGNLAVQYHEMGVARGVASKWYCSKVGVVSMAVES